MTATYDAVVNWARQFGLALDETQLGERIFEDSFELNQWLVAALAPSGFEAFLEQGCPPSEYIPRIIRGCLSLIDDRHCELGAVTTTDHWMTAKADILSGSDHREITINGVEDSDWVPSDLLKQMELFSKTFCSKVLFSILGEDPFIVLYVPQEAIDELETIRQGLPQPEWMEEQY